MRPSVLASLAAAAALQCHSVTDCLTAVHCFQHCFVEQAVPCSEDSQVSLGSSSLQALQKAYCCCHNSSAAEQQQDSLLSKLLLSLSSDCCLGQTLA